MQCFLGHSSCPSYKSQDSPPQCGLTVLIFTVFIRLNCPGHLLNFWTLKVGAYLRWALFGGWALIKFSTFSASVVCLFCNKTVTVNNKTRRCKVSVKYSEENSVFGKSLISTFSVLWGWERGRGWALIWVSVGVGGKWDGDGRLFEAGRLLTFSAFRMGTYSRWALIRGWALVRINTVICY